MKTSFYDFKAKSLGGKEISMEEYKGKDSTGGQYSKQMRIDPAV